MAYNNFLLDRLIRALVKNPSDADIERCRRSALRTLGNNHFVRINQFEITARLQGLEEKWMIHNNDPLAEALHVRRAELSVRSNKWTPEILSLLLQLSDRPTEHPNLADPALPGPELPSAPPTWSEIVAEDPLDDQDGLWKNVDFAADSSDDGKWTESVYSDHPVRTPESSVAGQAVEARIETLIEPVTNISLWEIHNAQNCNAQEDDRFSLNCEQNEEPKPKTSLTELQALRGVIFALLGLPTTIFSQENEWRNVSKADFLEHASQESLTGLLQGFAVIVNKILRIRHYIEKDASIPLEQTFQATLALRLEIFDSALSAIQTKILLHDTQAVTSLLKLYDETSKISRLLLQVHDVLLELGVDSTFSRPFRILEYLFDRTCVNQGIGDAEGYEYMANLFFDCFQTYLKPIRWWMEKGQLIERDEVIFIKKNKKNLQLDSVWRDQYHLIKDSNDDLYAPKFLHVAAKKIFKTGKSVDFLRRLGWENSDLRQDPAAEVAMTYEAVCQSSDLGLFSPFAELFDVALNKWISGKRSLSELRGQLESRCGLQSSLDALEYIYFTNSAMNTNLNKSIFKRIDRGSHRWNDNFLTTESLQNAFNAISCIDIDRLQICASSASQQESTVARRTMGALELIRVSYTLPWPVANVISTDSIEIYQRVSTFLTQLQRAKYLLQLRNARSVQATNKKPLPQLYTLRHRLLWLTNTMLTYITDMVILSATADMRSLMDRAEDVDSMIAVHNAYVTKLEDQCFLLKKHTSIRQAIISLLDLTVLFSDVQTSYATRQAFSDSESKFTDKKANQKRAIHSKVEKAATAASGDEDSDNDPDETTSGPSLHGPPPDVEKLEHMLDTFKNLQSFLAAAIRAVSKTDSGLSWEMLANNLAMGLEKR